MGFPAFLGRHKLAAILTVVIVTPVIVCTVWACVSLSYSYSSGERAGILQKISHRGWLCKTWEGELQLTAIPGSAPEVFDFSVRSDSVAEMLNKMDGERVVLTYEQHKGVPTSCFGDTEYFITAVRPVGTP